jgi:hypothetical protein
MRVLSSAPWRQGRPPWIRRRRPDPGCSVPRAEVVRQRDVLSERALVWVIMGACEPEPGVEQEL